MSNTDWINTDWLLTVLDNSLDEVYFIGRDSGRFWHVNQTALSNLQQDLQTMLVLSPVDMSVDMTQAQWNGYVGQLHGGDACVCYETRHWRRDGTFYPVSFRLFSAGSDSPPIYIAIGTDISVAKATARALQLSETRYQAIVTNIPGLVFQCRREHDQQFSFTYLSERCSTLLGVSAEALMDEPRIFFDLILPEDRDGLTQALDRSMFQLTALNWQGRIWIADWQDVKWINIRATPRKLASGTSWDGVITNITKTKREQEEVRRSHAQLAELSAHVQQLKEQERTRIAREIHDDLGGNVTAIKMALALLRKRHPNHSDTSERLDYLDQLVDRTIESIHRISGDLRPAVLDFGIVAAIEWQAREFMRLTGIPLQLACAQEDIELSADQATALFRIFQEALTNITKHAKATNVDVKLRELDNCVEMTIADNGQGMEQSDQIKPHSFGLRGMTERVESLHGELTIDSTLGLGTRLLIRIPLSKHHESE